MKSNHYQQRLSICVYDNGTIQITVTYIVYFVKLDNCYVVNRVERSLKTHPWVLIFRFSVSWPFFSRLPKHRVTLLVVGWETEYFFKKMAKATVKNRVVFEAYLVIYNQVFLKFWKHCQNRLNSKRVCFHKTIKPSNFKPSTFLKLEKATNTQPSTF